MYNINIYGNNEILTILKILYKFNPLHHNIKLTESKINELNKNIPLIYGTTIKNNNIKNNESERFICESEYVLVTNKNSLNINIDYNIYINMINNEIVKDNDIKILINSDSYYIDFLKENGINIEKCDKNIIINKNNKLENILEENNNYIGIVPNIYYEDNKNKFNKIEIINIEKTEENLLNYKILLYTNIYKFKNDKLNYFYNNLYSKNNFNIIKKLGYNIIENIYELTENKSNNQHIIFNTKIKDNYSKYESLMKNEIEINKNKIFNTSINMIDNILSKIDKENDYCNETIFFIYENKNIRKNDKCYIEKIYFCPYYIKVLFCYIENDKKIETVHILDNIIEIKNKCIIYQIKDEIIYNIPISFEKNKNYKILFKYKDKEFKNININIPNTITFIESLWRINIDKNDTVVIVLNDLYYRKKYYKLIK